MTPNRTIAEIVARDLCIGCGLCEALTGGRVEMVMTPAGPLRPSPGGPVHAHRGGDAGVRLPRCGGRARVELGCNSDLVWGAYRSMARAWAGHPDVRHESATAEC